MNPPGFFLILFTLFLHSSNFSCRFYYFRMRGKKEAKPHRLKDPCVARHPIGPWTATGHQINYLELSRIFHSYEADQCIVYSQKFSHPKTILGWKILYCLFFNGGRFYTTCFLLVENFKLPVFYWWKILY